MKQTVKSSGLFLILAAALVFGYGTKASLAQTSPSVLYVPLIGITEVPEPLALPKGPGKVTYKYAVKNFLQEVPLTDIKVSDDNCSPVKFSEGDDNGDKKLDFSETWRFTCTKTVSQTTQSTATATGTANDITATHQAYATVVVGSKTPPPLVSIINITKVAYPLSLPPEGGKITYTYRVTNPGVVPLSYVTVTDNKCSAISNKLGDTNGNNLLDVSEAWIYTCDTTLTQTTTNTATVTGFANGLQASDNVALTVYVATSPAATAQANPNFPETGSVNNNSKSIVWEILAGLLVLLIIGFVYRRKFGKPVNKRKS